MSMDSLEYFRRKNYFQKPRNNLTYIFTLIYTLDEDTSKFVYCTLKFLYIKSHQTMAHKLSPTVFINKVLWKYSLAHLLTVLSVAAFQHQQQL